mmetsp:Transcript_11985/g.18445  ORF Transcript_11985/g.18445 Transcript_11985/m.18445 type:complete len:426 (-) Transcript_11985:145-1422(-)
MTISTAQSNLKPSCVKKSTSVKKVRGRDAVPFEEMERLMNLYGSIKALRIRGAAKKKGSAEEGDKKVPLKKDSIKRKFYRWFPNFEERFTRDEDGHYQPVNGHEYEMKYRAEMRQKSMTVVVNKRSDSITKKKYGQNEKIAERKKVTKSGNVLSRQVSSSDSSSNSNISNSDKNVEGVIGITIPDDIEIDRSNIVMPSPTTTAPGNNKNSSYLDNGYRAPSPLSFQEQPTKKAVSEEQDTIFSFVSQDSEEAGIAASELKGLFDEVDKQYYGEAMPMMQSFDPMPMPMMHSYGAMPMLNSYDPMSMMNSYAMMNSYDPMPMMNSYDQMQQMSELSALSSMLKSYPAYPMMNSHTHVGMSTMPMNSYDQCFTGRLSDDSVGNVSNSSSSGNSSINLNEQWGSDSDIEDCLFLGVGNEMVSTRPSFR